MTIVILHPNLGTKEYFTFLLESIIDDPQLLQALSQIADATVNLA
jgi:hypothetical protein